MTSGPRKWGFGVLVKIGQIWRFFRGFRVFRKLRRWNFFYGNRYSLHKISATLFLVGWKTSVDLKLGFMRVSKK